MSVLPRTLLISIVVLVGLTPLASADGPDDCIEMILQSYASGLRIIANAGESIALGFASGYPGDGVGYTIVITPGLCGGVGGQVAPTVGSLEGLLTGIPDLLPLP